MTFQIISPFAKIDFPSFPYCIVIIVSDLTSQEKIVKNPAKIVIFPSSIDITGRLFQQKKITGKIWEKYRYLFTISPYKRVKYFLRGKSRKIPVIFNEWKL